MAFLNQEHWHDLICKVLSVFGKYWQQQKNDVFGCWDIMGCMGTTLLTMALNVVQMKPGLRFAVEPHGGHFWSSQGQVQRPMDVISLRIDNQVRSLKESRRFSLGQKPVIPKP